MILQIKTRCCGNRKISSDFKMAAAQRPGGGLLVPISMGRYICLTFILSLAELMKPVCSQSTGMYSQIPRKVKL